MAWRLPVGFDAADGTTPVPLQPVGSGGASAPVGVPIPANDLTLNGNNADVDPNGNACTIAQPPEGLPEVERAEQATFSSTVRMIASAAFNFINLIGRGAFVQDSKGAIWRILSAKMKGERGGTATVTLVGESISFDSPPDDYQMIPVELGIDILKHQRYSWALLPYNSDSSTYYTLPCGLQVYYTQQKQTIIRMLQAYRDSPIYPDNSTINGAIQSSIMAQIVNGVLNVNVTNPGFGNTGIFPSSTPVVAAINWDGTNQASANGVYPFVNCPYFIVPIPVSNSNTDAINIALVAASELLSKLWRQEDTPYQVGYQVTWAQYYFAPVYENPGGYVENPVGIVPNYFLSPSQNGSNTIFDQIALINPQCYSSNGTTGGNLNISWLRKADEVVFERTWFKVTRTWVGSPVGHWDSDLYLPVGCARPQTAAQQAATSSQSYFNDQNFR